MEANFPDQRTSIEVDRTESIFFVARVFTFLILFRSLNFHFSLLYGIRSDVQNELTLRAQQWAPGLQVFKKI